MNKFEKDDSDEHEFPWSIYAFARASMLFTQFIFILYTKFFSPFREMNGQRGDHWFWSIKCSYFMFLGGEMNNFAIWDKFHWLWRCMDVG